MIIHENHFQYLVNQRGEVAHERADFNRWQAAYEASLEAIYQNIVPVLPHECGSLLDIGSGLGGIDIHLSRHYAHCFPHICLLDGDNGNPEVDWSFEPHNSMAVAFDFLHKNGVTDVSSLSPGNLDKWKGEPFDLVMSFAAWGFHIHPGNYLGDLMKVIHDQTVVIVEVRRTQEEWLRLFVEALGAPKVLFRANKLVRLAFRA
jgi:hypothetical protein